MAADVLDPDFAQINVKRQQTFNIIRQQLVERILKHADGSVARTFDEDIEDHNMVADIDIRRIIDGKTYTNLTKNTPT